MKSLTFAGFALSLGLLLSGCGHLDTTPPASADRVLNGTVDHAGEELPDGSEVIVRVVDFSRGENRGEVLGEATIANPGRMPVPFRIEYRAEDAQLLRTVNVEARVSVGGQLRYTTTTAHPVTIGNVNDAHVISVQAATKH